MGLLPGCRTPVSIIDYKLEVSGNKQHATNGNLAATRNNCQIFGRNMQQLEKSQPQRATIWACCQVKESFGNMQQIASGNWQQIGK